MINCIGALRLRRKLLAGKKRSTSLWQWSIGLCLAIWRITKSFFTTSISFFLLLLTQSTFLPFELIFFLGIAAWLSRPVFLLLNLFGWLSHILSHTQKKKKITITHCHPLSSTLLYSPPPLPSWAVRWECVFEEGGRGVWWSNVSLDRDPLWGVDVLRLGAPKADWHSASNSLVVYGGTTANVRHAVRPFLHFSLRQLFLPPHANNELCKYLRDIHMQLFQSSPSWSSKAPYCPPLPPVLRHFCMWGSLIGLQWLLAPSGQYAQTGAEPVS